MTKLHDFGHFRVKVKKMHCTASLEFFPMQKIASWWGSAPKSPLVDSSHFRTSPFTEIKI